MRDHLGVAGVAADTDGLQGLGDGADLIDLDQRGVADPPVYRFGDEGGVSDEDVVAHQLDPLPQARGEPGPALPIALGETVLDAPHGKAGHDLLVAVDELIGGEAVAADDVAVALPEFAGRGVEWDRDAVPAGGVAGVGDRVDEQGQHVLGASDGGGEAAFVADPRGMSAGGQPRLEPSVHLGAGAHGLGKGGGAQGREHEFLEVQVVGGVGTAVDYIGAAYWFNSSTSFANPAVTVGRTFTDTFAGIAPGSLPGFIGAQLAGAVMGRTAP